MFRSSTVLRSTFAAAARTPAAVRPAVARRIAAVTPRSVIASPRAPALGWTSVRCYAASSGLSKQEVEDRIKGLLQGFDKVTDPSKITPTAHFANDLGLDSLDTVEVVMAIEEEFSIEIPDKDADTIHSIDKAVEYILNQPDAN